MPTDSLSYNPNFLHKDSVSWFHEFICLQDQVPSSLIGISDDSVFISKRIIPVKIERPKAYEKSIFSMHQLQPSGKGPVEREKMNPAWVGGVILICFFLFAIAQYSYFRRMQQIFKAFFANRLFNQLSRDGGIYRERISIFLFSSFIIGMSLFIFTIYGFYSSLPKSTGAEILLFIKIFFAVLLFYLLKMGLFNLSGVIFKSVKEASDYVLNIFIFGEIAGVALLPVIILVTYIHSEIMIYAGVVMLASLYLYRLFRGLVIAGSNAKISVYYLFLYLCTLEILPLILISKALILFNGQ
jgi:hypothetical protein